MDAITIHTDGAARGNPGPAAIAYVIDWPGLPVVEHSETIGSTTNNQAEYQALKAALTKLIDQLPNGKTIECFADSELMVKQLNGLYKMKNVELRPHYDEILRLAAQLKATGNHVSFTHVLRSKNKRADELGNWALDNKV